MNTRYIVITTIMLAVFWALPGQPAAQLHRIAIVQHQLFQPFTEAREGFVKGLEALGYENDKVRIEDFNALSDIGKLEAEIADMAGRSDIDLIFSIGTHSTERLIQAVKHIPIVFTIVSDPVEAGIIRDWQGSGANYTGVETPDYFGHVLRLMHRYHPFRSLGMLYLAGSPCHEAGIKRIELLAKELNFKFVARSFPLRNDQKVPYPAAEVRRKISTALEAVCPRVEAFFVQTSNTFTQNFDLFRSAFERYRLVSAGDPTSIHEGLIMGIGKDARRFGEQAALYAMKILEGAQPASLPMDIGTKLSIELNLKAAQLVGYEPPFELLSGADRLYRDLARAVVN